MLTGVKVRACADKEIEFGKIYRNANGRKDGNLI